MKYKLLAVDIDGTLLNSKGKLTEETKKIIIKAIQNKVVFVISTGRPIQGVESLIDEIGFDLPFITYNGAMVVKGKSREILYEKNLSRQDAQEVYNYGEKYNTTMIIWAKNKLYVNVVNEKSREYSKLASTDLIKINRLEEIEDDITKILCYDDHSILENYQNELRIILNKNINNHFSRPYFLEFVDSNATKAIAIEKLCDYFSINIKETIAIGDGYNDLSMIKVAGLGVAMENAPQEIKDTAKYVTTSCDEEGVANVIKKFILEEM